MLSVIRKKLMQKYKINYINIVSVVFASITIFSLAFTYVYLFDMSTIGFFGHFIVVINFLLIILGIFIFFAYFKKNKSLKEKYIDRDRVFSGSADLAVFNGDRRTVRRKPADDHLCHRHCQLDRRRKDHPQRVSAHP